MPRLAAQEDDFSGNLVPHWKDVSQECNRKRIYDRIAEWVVDVLYRHEFQEPVAEVGDAILPVPQISAQSVETKSVSSQPKLTMQIDRTEKYMVEGLPWVHFRVSLPRMLQDMTRQVPKQVVQEGANVPQHVVQGPALEWRLLRHTPNKGNA